MLSLFNLHTRGINAPNVVVGMAIFCGGLAQLLAGMWEFPKGNTFGATGKLFDCMFTCYSGIALHHPRAFWGFPPRYMFIPLQPVRHSLTFDVVGDLLAWSCGGDRFG